MNSEEVILAYQKSKRNKNLNEYICGRYPHMNSCGCIIPCRIALKEVTLDLVRPFLYISPVQGAYLDTKISEYNIKHIINASNDEYTERNDINYYHLTLEDTSTTNLIGNETFKQSIQLISEAISNQEGVLVHCHAGKSRSVSICVAYLIIYDNLNVNDAIAQVQLVHPRADPNEGFCMQLAELQPGCQYI